MKRLINKFNSFRSGLFSADTDGIRSMELFFALSSLSFSVTIISQGGDLFDVNSYKVFNFLGPFWIWFSMLFVAVLQIKNLNKKGVDAKVTSSLLLKSSSLIYFVIAVMFSASYPPVVTGVGTYFLYSFFCMVTAFEIDDRFTQKMLLIKETIGE